MTLELDGIEDRIVRLSMHSADLAAAALTPDYALGGHTASLGLCWLPANTLPGFGEGMVIGQCARPEDLPINICKKKQLTNIRAAATIQFPEELRPLMTRYRSRHRLMIRLVKGAYWDSEIKRAQVEGLEGYPVYTRKVYTDVSYIACARKLLSVPEVIYPQFATHNAHTLSAIYHIAGQNYYPGQYEFQCLHGMGEPLYEQVVGKVSEGKLNRPCRVYAPVGTHETLLPYLVRRLLENGANSSFVNRLVDETVSVADLVADPLAEVAAAAWGPRLHA